MWEESWLNLQLKIKDMPYYHYKGSEKKKDPGVKEGTIDILKQKFGKYIAP